VIDEDKVVYCPPAVTGRENSFKTKRGEAIANHDQRERETTRMGEGKLILNRIRKDSPELRETFMHLLSECLTSSL